MPFFNISKKIVEVMEGHPNFGPRGIGFLVGFWSDFLANFDQKPENCLAFFLKLPNSSIPYENFCKDIFPTKHNILLIQKED